MASAYIVKSGDTLSRIAQKNNSTVSGLMRLNPSIEDPNRIYAGQEITLPESNGQAFTSAQATDISDTASCEDEYVEIVHVTGTEELFFLTEDDLNDLIEEENLVGGAIEKLYQDLESSNPTETSSNSLPADAEGALATPIQEEKEATVNELEELDVVGTSMQTTPKLTEIKRLKGNKHYTYVRSDKIANHWRSYKMTAKDRDRASGWLSRSGVNTGKLREAVEADFGFRLKSSFWQLDPESNFSKSINQFHEEVSWSIWGDEQDQERQRNETGFDASAEAQFMRFAAGSGAFAEFNPSAGKLHVQARADAQFSLAQGKASIEQAYPANNDSEIRIYYRKGGWGGERLYETLGHFQARLTITLSGYAGASACIAGNIKVDCSQGVPSLKGITSKPNDGQGLDAEASAFAGIRGGCELLGGLYWTDTLSQQSDWKTLCQVGPKVEGAAGIGAEAYLKIIFSPRTGKFIVNAHAGLVVGLGASGSFILQVNANDLVRMVHFVYNSLLKVDFRYLEIFEEQSEAFKRYVQISLFALSKGLDYANAAAELANSGIVAVESWVMEFISEQQEGLSQENESEELAENILNDMARGEDSVFLHSPPEVKGPILNKLTYDYWLTPQLFDGTLTKVRAIAEILKSFQGWRDFEEATKRMNPDGVAIPENAESNAQRLFSFIGKNRHDYLMFKQLLEGKSAIADAPVQLDPFSACRNCGIA
ncbi:MULTISPECIES: LysM peptidoglycan-binding domain-containing protein [Marinobacter]|uniref:LysM peptidoglycan-binding domain-containing protein n=1 Tax=Marinobacter TaxID=2742 RepID=UPI000DAE3E06|nr:MULTISPECIES: LysM peptidoglycan-binding domain-containing protein [Marinobacter]